MLLYPHLMAKLAWSWQKIEIFSWSEAWNPPTWGCKSMVEGLTIMLGVFITLLYILYNAKHLLFKQPTCCYTPTWWPNLPWSWQEIEIFSWSEAWNPPTWGCKSMVEGLTIMLGVFMTLLYTYTMPNIYYSSNLHAAIPPLDGQTCLKLAGNRDFFLIWGMKPANMGCKSMVEGLTIMLGVFITLLYIYTMPNIYYSTTYMLLYPHLMAKLAWSWQEIEIFSWSEAWNPPTWAVKVWWRDLQSCWECSSLVIHPIQCQTSTIQATYMLLYPHLMAKLAWSWQEIEDFFLIWGMKPANMGL